MCAHVSISVSIVLEAYGFFSTPSAMLATSRWYGMVLPHRSRSVADSISKRRACEPYIDRLRCGPLVIHSSHVSGVFFELSTLDTSMRFFAYSSEGPSARSVNCAQVNTSVSVTLGCVCVLCLVYPGGALVSFIGFFFFAGFLAGLGWLRLFRHGTARISALGSGLWC